MEIAILVIVLALKFVMDFWPLLIFLIAIGVIVWIVKVCSSIEERKIQIESYLNQPLPYLSEYHQFKLARECKALDCEKLCSFINYGYKLKNELAWLEKVHRALCQKRDVCIRESRRKQAEEYQTQITQRLSDIQAKKKEIDELRMDLPPVEHNIQQSYRDFYDSMRKSSNKIDCFDALFWRYNAIVDNYSEDLIVVYFPMAFVKLNRKKQEIEVYEYSEIVTSENYAKNHIEKPDEDDDIAYMTYRYARKDGERDMRYSYENNPEIYCVYRGSIYFNNVNDFYRIEFKNKKYTESAVHAFEDLKKAKQIVRRRKVDGIPSSGSSKLQVYVGDKVQHNSFGVGRVVAVIGGKYINVLFDIGEKKFKYPDAFDQGYLNKCEN